MRLFSHHLLRDNKICFLPTHNNHPVWERGDMETESLLTEFEISLLGGVRCRADAKKHEVPLV